MKHLDLPLIADTFFYTSAAFLASIAALRYFGLSLPLAAAAAALIALAAGTGCALFLGFRHKKRAMTRAETEKRDALLLHLALEREDRVRAQLARAYEADGKKVSNDEELYADGERVVPLFTMEPVTADTVASLIRRYGEEPFTLLVNKLTAEAEKLLRSFGRRAVRGDEVYALFRRTDTFPAPMLLSNLPRPKWRVRFRAVFSKRSARPFFISGALLLIMSLFTFFPRYYLITGSVLLVLSVILRFFGKDIPMFE